MDPKRNIFVKCMPCFGVTHTEEDPEEYIKNNFGSQYTEYEYVIENLLVTPVPKALLDEISTSKPSSKKKKTKEKTKVIKTNRDAGKDEISVAESTSKNNVLPEKVNSDFLPEGVHFSNNPEGVHFSNKPEECLMKNKIFGAGGSQDIRYNPCYVHLCSDKNACTECKMGPDNKKDILRRMLLPPGPINLQANPLKPQVIS